MIDEGDARGQPPSMVGAGVEGNGTLLVVNDAVGTDVDVDDTEGAGVVVIIGIGVGAAVVVVVYKL